MLRRALVFLVATALVTSALASIALVSGCDDGSVAGTPPPLPTSSGDPMPVDASAESTPVDPIPVEAGQFAQRWVGTLVATTPVVFGGSPYCKYKITLKLINVDVTIKDGVATAAYVKDLGVEETVPPCPNAPAPPTTNEYSLASSKKLTTGALHIELTGFAPNRPQTTLTLEGMFDSAHISPVAEWHRTDQNPPLDWRVKVPIVLDRR